MSVCVSVCLLVGDGLLLHAVAVVPCCLITKSLQKSLHSISSSLPTILFVKTRYTAYSKQNTHVFIMFRFFWTWSVGISKCCIQNGVGMMT